MTRQRMITVLVCSLVACALCVGTAFAQTVWIVDHAGTGDFLTIQAAITAASSGDTVIVKDGTYTGVGNRDIDFLGRAITLRSQNGANKCIIDCQGVGRGFEFHSGEGPDSVLDGFTIRNGTAWNNFEGGGGISCSWSSSPTIANCIIEDNEAYIGGGILCYESAAPHILNCLIRNNHAREHPPAGGGGGIASYHYAGQTVENCTIVGNTAFENGGGIAVYEGDSVTVVNSIIWGNTAYHGSQISMWWGTPPIALSVSYSVVQGGAGGVHYWDCPTGGCVLNWGWGNTTADPLFVTGPLGDSYLNQAGPCIDAGSGTAESRGLDTATTDTNHIGDTGIVDMGFHCPVLSRINLTSPASASVLSSAPRLDWTADGHTNHGFVVGFYLFGVNPFWQTAFSTYDFGGQFIPWEGWDMPSGLWTAIPSDTYVVWWVVGLDANRSPFAAVQSETYGWFQKQ